ncbi:DNA-binding GntR family transcriptional regulator [Pararhizobium capsulatum DSM 1112]|uniref:DNA-binding GntR family transcriptional regulator n=1 Tax=Pararhizobium capsulatum DSM 1112 TaxID=1121113 RepID=A0ABU0C464_9HYPH|nr:GntR family transcriptional regulator [Pararhizobium capsulatum]MDQ0323872.1 DNA-binding GntR family transcriptional regulator [Pararhizobium capsulatum DSM 1112]
MPNDTQTKATAPWKPLSTKRATLHEDLVARLTEMIQEGELPPGSRMPEIQLCEHFGVSRTPLREALKVLAADGWLVWRANHGARVSEVNVKEVAEVFELLGGIERLIGRLLVERIVASEHQELDAMHLELAHRHATEDRVSYFKINQNIHRRMAEFTGNRSLQDTYEALSKKVYRARTMANYGHERWDQSLKEHIDFMEALRRGDPADFAERLEQHNSATCDAVISALNTIQTSSTTVKRSRPHD